MQRAREDPGRFRKGISGTCSSQATSARSFHRAPGMEATHPLPRGFAGADFRLGMRSQAPPNLRCCREATEGYNASGPNYLICLQLPDLAVELVGAANPFSRFRAAGPTGLRASLSKWGSSFEDRKARINSERRPEDSRRRKLQKTGDKGREAGFRSHPESRRLNVCVANQQFHGNPGDFTL